MTNPTPSPQPPQDSTYVPPTPLRCFIGASIAGGLGTALYFLTISIAQTFATKPLPSGNAVAVNIAIAVRTLVVGMSTLATSVFAIATLGLVALGIQLLFKREQAER
ncbi:MAG: DUF3082 domain-containing protein [Oculatellaceae cyanobacterium bins.114]|nr:DUF3082 domain-containing protein [Oculatellaceae cyanobacterium bins.114]